MRKKKIRKSMSDKTLNTIVSSAMVVFVIIILYPLIYIVSSSFSSGPAVTSGQVLLWPVEPTLGGYKIVFDSKDVWTGYKNTLIYTGLGTVLNVVATILVAYPLSRKDLPCKGFYMTLFMIPMFFSGGLIPSYLVMSKLHLVNSRWAMMLPGLVSIYNMIVMRTFFQNSIPEELLEASKMDGISDIGYMTKILLPLSKASIAVVTLYYAVAHWNAYFNALIYLRDKSKQPLQLVLRRIMTSASLEASAGLDPEVVAEIQSAVDVMKYALVVVVTVPILVIYPIVQKYFEKGVMIGSVKG